MHPKQLRCDPLNRRVQNGSLPGVCEVTCVPDSLSIPDKTELRRQLRRLRKQIPDTVRRRAAKAVRQLALRLRLLSRKRRIGCYVPANGELDVSLLRTQALLSGAHVYLPIVPRARQRQLMFASEPPCGRWRNNRYGILEPHLPRRQLRAWALDVLFVPLLGFDAAGNRIGMGGGYYDATLAFRRWRRHWRGPRLIGVAFEAQYLEHIPTDPWDVPLDAVLTEQRVWLFKRITSPT